MLPAASRTRALLRWVCHRPALTSTATINARHSPASKVIFQVMDSRDRNILGNSFPALFCFALFPSYRQPHASPEHEFAGLTPFFWPAITPQADAWARSG